MRSKQAKVRTFWQQAGISWKFIVVLPWITYQESHLVIPVLIFWGEGEINPPHQTGILEIIADKKKFQTKFVLHRILYKNGHNNFFSYPLCVVHGEVELYHFQGDLLTHILWRKHNLTRPSLCEAENARLGSTLYQPLDPRCGQCWSPINPQQYLA